jgi:L,D-peptidoglycan transpeptidase YkuD (ErfK/YbiS/YcfS/YnhG family)
MRSTAPRRRRAALSFALVIVAAGAGGIGVAAGAAAGTPARAAPPHPELRAAVDSRRSSCPANLADELRSTGPARQLVTVNARSAATSVALLTTWQRQGSCWVKMAGPWPARLGVNGISGHKVEGDGTTPAGDFGIGPVMYGNGPNPGVHYPYHHLVCGDWWDEDPSSRWYNTFKHIACGSYPDWTGGDSEPLWTETTAYQSFAWIEYNAHPVIPGRGSAIFLHDGIADPTTGCVSLRPSQLDTVLDWLRRGDDPSIVIGSDRSIRRY